jgi:hypothetical protein
MTVVCLFPAPCKGMGYTKKSGEKRTSIHRRWDFGALYVDIQSQQERSFWATAIKQTSLKHSHHSLHMSHPTSEDFPRNPQMLRFVTWAGLSLPSRPEYTIYGFPYIYICMYIQLYTYTSSISLSYLVRIVHTVVSIGLLRRQYLRLQHDSNSASWDNVTQPTTRTRGRDVSQSQLRSTSWDVNHLSLSSKPTIWHCVVQGLFESPRRWEVNQSKASCGSPG